MTEIEKKTGMTDAECEYWDNYITTGDAELGPNLLQQGVQPGFARNILLLSELDTETIECLHAEAAATRHSSTTAKKLAKIVTIHG